MTTQEEKKHEAVTNDPVIITGYQFGEHGNFIGEYRFEKNKDKAAIHMPPRTTLLPPPTDLAVDQESFFNGTDWEIRTLALPWLPDRELPVDDVIADNAGQKEESGHGD